MPPASETSLRTKMACSLSHFDFESMFIKVGNSETRKGLGATGGRLGRAAVSSLRSQRRSGLGDRFRGLAGD